MTQQRVAPLLTLLMLQLSRGMQLNIGSRGLVGVQLPVVHVTRMMSEFDVEKLTLVLKGCENGIGVGLDEEKYVPRAVLLGVEYSARRAR